MGTAMDVSNNGLNFIARYEGFRENAYKDAVGVWTIGYGHTANVKEGDHVTKEKAIEYLDDDATKVVNFLNSLGLKWTQNQFDALVSFGFNCGNGNLKKLVKGRTPDQIADKMLLYTKAGGKELPGLVQRRKAERDLFMRESGNVVASSKSGQNALEIAKEKWPKDLKIGHVSTKGGSLRVRAYPGVTQTIIATLPDKSSLRIHIPTSQKIGTVTWYHVYRDDLPYGGFVSGEYVSL